MAGIRCTYRSVDGVRITKTYKTPKRAAEFVQKWAGTGCDIGRNDSRAVSFDGVGVVDVEGARITSLLHLLDASITPADDDRDGDPSAESSWGVGR